MKHARELVITCEHAGNRVPSAQSALFESPEARAALASHRGWDFGALAVAQLLSSRLGAPLLTHTYTRLLVDLNRSEHHRALFSEFSRRLDRPAREALLTAYYRPHRDRVVETIRRAISRSGCVVHIAVHSFAAAVDDRERLADIGLLYDPGRADERIFCRAWKQALECVDPALKVRRNYPYRGTADGLTTHLRRRFPAGCYSGIELELNQRALHAAAARHRIASVVAESLAAALRSSLDYRSTVVS